MPNPRTLYLSYTGLLEPLGKSQILGYLKRLSADYTITLVTFEKPADLENVNEFEALKTLCGSYQIDWQPQKYHKKPRLLATLWDMWILLWMTFKFASKVELIHCRNYIPAIAAWFVGLFTNTPFVFDMRALWIEELIEAKSIKRHSFYHSMIAWFERKLLKSAAQVVTLTHAVIPYLAERYPWLDTDKFTVIPTCVDLTKFSYEDNRNRSLKTVGTMGTVVSGRYQLELMLKAFHAFDKHWPNLEFKIVTRDSLAAIDEICQKVGFPSNKLSVFASEPAAIKQHIADLDLAVVFFTPGLSTLGTSPTRIGEFLACGIPVIVNSGVGDTAKIISENRVGAVIDGHNFEKLIHDLELLIADPSLAERCRALSENMLSADVGASRYLDAYKKAEAVKLKRSN